MEIFVTADLHFNHVNIIKYCNRPFSDVKEMDQCLRDNWNSRINRRDTVYVVGDFAFVKSVNHLIDIRRGLNGNIHLVRGNHDSPGLLKKITNQNIFASIRDTNKFKYKDKLFVLSHILVYCYLSFFVTNLSFFVTNNGTLRFTC